MPAQGTLEFAVVGTNKAQGMTLHKVASCAKSAGMETLNSGKKVKELRTITEDSTQWSQVTKNLL